MAAGRSRNLAARLHRGPVELLSQEAKARGRGRRGANTRLDLTRGRLTRRAEQGG